MRGRDYWTVTVPGLAILALAVLAEIGTDTRQIAPALVAVLLTWPVAMVTLCWMRRLIRRNPRGVGIGMIAGTVLRMAVAAGGAGAVYAWTDLGIAAGIMFWVWIVVAYLSTLAAEVFVLARPGWVGWGGRRKG